MKAYVRWLLLIIAFAVLPLLFFFYFTQTSNKKLAPQAQVVSDATPGLPMRLLIPAINVIANIQHVGVTSLGELDVPSNTVDVGWFKLGYRPGEKGSAVISGHFDGKNGEVGVFTNLHTLKEGDKLYTEDEKGITTSFIVRESRMYDPGYAEEVFSTNDGVHLNLITCDGVWDGVKKIYSKRLIVFADIIE